MKLNRLTTLVALTIAGAACSAAPQTTDNVGTEADSLEAMGGQSSGSSSSAHVLVALRQTNLIRSPEAPAARLTDELHRNAWGAGFTANGLYWTAANATGKGLAYSGVGPAGATPSRAREVNMTRASGEKGNARPTGQYEVLTPTGTQSTTVFKGDSVGWVTEDGEIFGLLRSNTEPVTDAELRVDNSADGASYKGVAIVEASKEQLRAGEARLYAADFANAKIDIFDQDYQQLSCDGFSIRDVENGYAPFNVMIDKDIVYVAFARQQACEDDPTSGHGGSGGGSRACQPEEVHAPGAGLINAYDLQGNLLAELVRPGGQLNAPWGMQVTTRKVGEIPAGSLLVGNFGDGTIHVYEIKQGSKLKSQARHLGVVGDANKLPARKALVIPQLWDLVMVDPDITQGGIQKSGIFFASGPNDETAGLSGRLDMPTRSDP